MPRSVWFKVILVLAALWAPLSQADTGWQPIQETIRKSEKDPRQYQAIRLDNGMVAMFFPARCWISIPFFLSVFSLAASFSRAVISAGVKSSNFKKCFW